MGLFITFEGGEGTGKTTQAAMLVARLQREGHDALGLREPGGTPLGDYLREWLKRTDEPLTPEAELFLFVAGRAQLTRTVITPALAQGKTVVCDRYADSTTVYQGDGRRLPRPLVRVANRAATGGLTPDLTVLLDAPAGATLKRAAARASGGTLDRFEAADAAFHRRVRAGFRRLARREPERWLVLDALAPAEATAAVVWERVARMLTGARAGAPEPGADALDEAAGGH